MFFRQVGRQVERIAKTILPVNVPPATAQIIKAEALQQYGHLNEALIEAKKARDSKFASAHEIELAKGKMVEVMNAMEKQKTISPQPR